MRLANDSWSGCRSSRRGRLVRISWLSVVRLSIPALLAVLLAARAPDVRAQRADRAIRLADLAPARQRTVVVLGHEHWGLPDEAWDHLDQVVEIPMVGAGSSLNLAVAGSLVLYKLAGLA